MPDKPTPPVNLKDPRRQALAGAIDTYLQGNPAHYRMPMQPRSPYPEIYDGFYNDPTAQLHALYEEMLTKDGVIKGAVEQRRAAVLAKERELLPASADPNDERITRFVQAALDNIGGEDGGFDADLANLLHGVQIGISICEVVWQYSDEIYLDSGKQHGHAPERGRFILPAEIRHCYPGNFRFDARGRMYIVPGGPAGDMRPVPDRKYLVLRHGSNYENPYGQGLLSHVWWYYFFKTQNMRSWLTYNDKYGAPTALGYYPPGADPDAVANLRTALKKISTDTAITAPSGTEISLLETKGAGAAPFREHLEYCDDCIARAILGSTLTSGEGRRSGSLALGKVHADVAADKVEQDARALMWTINRQLIRWIVDFNFGASEMTPTWLVDTSEDEDLVGTSEWLERLFGLGYRIPANFVAERFGVPAPAEGEEYLGIEILEQMKAALRPTVVAAPPASPDNEPPDENAPGEEDEEPDDEDEETQDHAEPRRTLLGWLREFASKKKRPVRLKTY